MGEAERKRPRIDPYYEGEPHPLPKTRARVERWAAEGCPTSEEEALPKNVIGPPCLMWVPPCRRELDRTSVVS